MGTHTRTHDAGAGAGAGAHTRTHARTRSPHTIPHPHYAHPHLPSRPPARPHPPTRHRRMRARAARTRAQAAFSVLLAVNDYRCAPRRGGRQTLSKIHFFVKEMKRSQQNSKPSTTTGAPSGAATCRPSPCRRAALPPVGRRPQTRQKRATTGEHAVRHDGGCHDSHIVAGPALSPLPACRFSPCPPQTPQERATTSDQCPR